MSAKVTAVDWPSLKSGTMLHMRDFPTVKLLKLDNSKGCYFNYSGETILVDVGEYTSEVNGSYYYFQTEKDDWHPLTNRLWTIHD